MPTDEELSARLAGKWDRLNAGFGDSMETLWLGSSSDEPNATVTAQDLVAKLLATQAEMETLVVDDSAPTVPHAPESDNGGFYNIAGLKVVISIPIVCKLTWLERLLSWPWRPWVKQSVSDMADGEVIQIADRSVMNEKTAQMMLRASHELRRGVVY